MDKTTEGGMKSAGNVKNLHIYPMEKLKQTKNFVWRLASPIREGCGRKCGKLLFYPMCGERAGSPYKI